MAIPSQDPGTLFEKLACDRTDHVHHKQLRLKFQGEELKEKLNPFMLGGMDARTKKAEPYPYFRRTSISQNILMSTQDDTSAYARLVACLKLRQKYMQQSLQFYPKIVSAVINSSATEFAAIETKLNSIPKKHDLHSCKRIDALKPHIKDPWNINLQRDLELNCSMINGIVNVADKTGNFKQFPYPTFQDHVEDVRTVWETATSGPAGSYSTKRLNLLRSKFDIHVNLNEVTELAVMSSVPKRDFYNVLKVDTHIHAAACMTSRNLLNRIRQAIEDEPDMDVLPGKKKGDFPIKLIKLFETLDLDPEDLSVNSLDVHADRTTRNRFDRFDNLYNVAGEAELRQIFLKPTKNLVRGRYFADLVKDSLKNKESKYEYAELRISTGRSLQDWKDLANWAKEFEVYSDHNRWVLQIPRSYSEMRRANSVINFEEFLSSAFLPMFLATSNPASNPEIATFLEYVIALDSVSDESRSEVPMLVATMPNPADWTTVDNPPYAYYLYYMYAILTILNQFRKERGMNIFKLRPHSGESGSPYHLASAFLLAENISHGIVLDQSPSLEYLYYLAQIPIAMSPLSNNALFLPYAKNPLKKFFAEGIPVTLSTDDPLMFHMTSEPLAEEYAVASIVFELSSCDQCELARNSVLMSGFSDEIKAYWLGKDFKEDGVGGNHIGFTNVPDVRVAYRQENLIHELKSLCEGLVEQEDKPIAEQ